jgi:hypothetical protein
LARELMCRARAGSRYSTAVASISTIRSGNARLVMWSFHPDDVREREDGVREYRFEVGQHLIELRAHVALVTSSQSSL